ncbi:thiazolylpeptide-type bacteriocin [Streptomyces sp. NPDC018031]|uniref:thiazolylpeptide-type bacteriocin n=1 Tax=Streptomyces sp. NPDC018031 TaxID=3365033 RepID=UPI0037B09510
MSDIARNADFDLQDMELDLGELTVTSMRDTAALPEGGASWGSCSCQGSSSCAQPQLETGVVDAG